MASATRGAHGAKDLSSASRQAGDSTAQRPSLMARIGNHMSRYWQLWLMSLPAMIFVGLFAYVPMYGIQLAFREFVPGAGLSGGKFVGFKYFIQFFNSPQFDDLIINTIRVSLGTLVLGFIAPIILALLINQIAGKRTKSFVQTITYMPHFISTVVIVSMINIFLAPNSGMIGRFLGETNILGNPDAFAPIYWITEVWQHCGWNSIIYLAALAGVDTSLYEAAKMDGAGRLQLIRYVDIPTILPTCGILLILNMGSVLGVGFEKVYLMQNSLNLSGSEVLSTFVYKMGLVSNQYSYSTAINLFNTVINFLFLIIANQVAKRASNTSIF
ncbi:sugar ABC transporter permease [Bifidobacterium lemurum]|uniref:Sugar ABC transporter permease n=1 Tax=Bifidobacterium lemurum TaxID=1603886 RepID=A0A261FS90_9BIFI|nr:ABC transporter permease subunit [Bifidobacterium lemurum]OZG62051.1 sugar ABC transporter permease [Bifidobacterium lemurum]QOL34881.1 sugar ABC transporter permease [Bifidobacterium lemurum]